MSNAQKFNVTYLTAIASALGAWASVVWIASSKASDIEVAKEEILELKASDKQQSAVLNRLDERSTMVLDALKELRAMLKN